jgi:hypothetical protein
MVCPVCQAPLPPSGKVCPTCGLPRELWPGARSPIAQAGGEDPYEQWVSALEGLRRQPPSGGFEERDPDEGHGPLLPEPSLGEEEVQVPPLAPADGLPLQELVDELSDLLQLGRRAGFNLSSFGPETARLLDAMRSLDPELSREALLSLRERLYTHLGDEFVSRLEDATSQLRTFDPFVRIDGALGYLDPLRDALRSGDLRQAQVTLRRLEGEMGLLEVQLGSVGDLLRSMTQLKSWLRSLGGDPSVVAGLERRAMEAARTGGRTTAETMLGEEAQRLSDLLTERLVEELHELSVELRDLRARGTDVEGAILLARDLTEELREARPLRAAQGLPRLREELRMARERPAAEEASR